MDKAKAAISDFMSKSGHHDTTVHEKVAPAVTHETVSPHRHENVTTAIDKEVHQDHYHTTVQPVHDREVLPEQHTHNIIPVEHRSHEHGNAKDVEQRLAQEAAQFKDQRTVNATRESHEVRPVVAGEHVHHHVHENIQPVVHKETIQPHVVHTTVPVHEVHHNAAQHHSTSALPAMSMADFQKQGGVLTGREERYDGFEGEPRNIGSTLGSGSHHTGSHHTGTTGTTGTTGLTGSRDTTGSGLTGSRDTTGSGLTGSRDTTGSGLTGSRDTTGSGLTGSRDTTGSGLTGTGSHHHNTTGTTGSTGLGSTTSGTTGTSSSTGTTHKASLLDKLNPTVDSNGDGKAGFMK